MVGVAMSIISLVGQMCICISFPVPSQPTDFKGEAKSETSILLSWIAPAQTGQDNQIMGYELLYKKGDDKEEVNGFSYSKNSYTAPNISYVQWYTFS